MQKKAEVRGKIKERKLDKVLEESLTGLIDFVSGLPIADREV
jgi:hypothetical protein